MIGKTATKEEEGEVHIAADSVITQSISLEMWQFSVL
jgi:hypothetical protein